MQEYTLSRSQNTSQRRTNLINVSATFSISAESFRARTTREFSASSIIAVGPRKTRVLHAGTCKRAVRSIWLVWRCCWALLETQRHYYDRRRKPSPLLRASTPAQSTAIFRFAVRKRIGHIHRERVARTHWWKLASIG